MCAVFVAHGNFKTERLPRARWCRHLVHVQHAAAIIKHVIRHIMHIIQGDSRAKASRSEEDAIPDFSRTKSIDNQNVVPIFGTVMLSGEDFYLICCKVSPQFVETHAIYSTPSMDLTSSGASFTGIASEGSIKAASFNFLSGVSWEASMTIV